MRKQEALETSQSRCRLQSRCRSTGHPQALKRRSVHRQFDIPQMRLAICDRPRHDPLVANLVPVAVVERNSIVRPVRLITQSALDRTRSRSVAQIRHPECALAHRPPARSRSPGSFQASDARGLSRMAYGMSATSSRAQSRDTLAGTAFACRSGCGRTDGGAARKRRWSLLRRDDGRARPRCAMELPVPLPGQAHCST